MATTKKNPDFQEPEEVNNTEDATITAEIKDPLTDEPILERPHTGASSMTGANEPMKEHTVNQPPPMDDFHLREDSPQAEKPKDSVNDDIQDLPPLEKMEASTAAATMLADGYSDILKFISGKVLRISNRRLEKMEDRGEVNLDIPLRFSNNQVIPTRGAIENFNTQVNSALPHLGLSDGAKEKVVPIIAKEFAKSNIGLGPWATVGAIVGIDFYKNNLPIWNQFMEAKNELYDAMREMTQAFRENGGVMPTFTEQPAQAAAQQTASEPAPQQQAPIVNMQPPPISNTADDIFNEIQAAHGQAGRSSLTTVGMASPGSHSSLAKPVRPKRTYKKRKKKIVRKIKE